MEPGSCRISGAVTAQDGQEITWRGLHPPKKCITIRHCIQLIQLVCGEIYVYPNEVQMQSFTQVIPLIFTKSVPNIALMTPRVFL